MNLTLNRTQFREDGIFGSLTDTAGNIIAQTLEHAYKDAAGTYSPKTPPGTYLCVRGIHKLANMSHTFVTFEITGVPGHTNILFHVGNFNDDSEGCCLLGTAVTTDKNGKQMLTASAHTFDNFMDLLKNYSKFTLTVKDTK